AVLLSYALPQFINSNYIMGIIVRILFYMILAGSLNIINGYSGQFNIGHAGFVCIGSYTEAILATRFGLSFWLLLPLAGIVTAMVGYVVALPTLRLKGIYLAIVTLGFSEIVRLMAQNWTSFTGGPMGIKSIPSPEFFGAKISSPMLYYYIALVLVQLSLFTSFRVIQSRVGRAWISIREDEAAAASLGVNTKIYKSINFMYGAFWAGIAGAAMAPYYRYIAADMFTLDEGFNILSMVIIGGQGTLVGPLLGAALVNIITEVFRFAASYRMVVYAILIIVMMWVRPQGILGVSNSILAGNKKNKKMKRSTANVEKKAVDV
ncbi:MAG: branched-chain amino acid ABC transporter permease, partial [Firmicutes bacterium]|nr:branched-chain amino acid ABC transporter permease [Bacillota bacterium]